MQKKIKPLNEGTEIDLLKEINRLNKKLSFLIDKQMNPKQTWVGVSIIQELTGWDREWMRKARNNNLIEYRRTSESTIEYLLESIHPMFIKR